MERDRRAADRRRVGRGRKLPGQLHGSTLDADPAQPGGVPRHGAVHDKRRRISRVQHGGQRQSAPSALAVQ